VVPMMQVLLLLFDGLACYIFIFLMGPRSIYYFYFLILVPASEPLCDDILCLFAK